MLSVLFIEIKIYRVDGYQNRHFRYRNRFRYRSVSGHVASFFARLNAVLPEFDQQNVFYVQWFIFEFGPVSVNGAQWVTYEFGAISKAKIRIESSRRRRRPQRVEYIVS